MNEQPQPLRSVTVKRGQELVLVPLPDGRKSAEEMDELARFNATQHRTRGRPHEL